jgi:hypothetical protein
MLTVATTPEMDLESRMRELLTQLAMTGNRPRRPDVLWLDPLDAPHQRYLDLYIREETDEGRAAVVALAEVELDRIRFSRGHPGAAETLEELFDRIVHAGEGWSEREVAIRLRTTEAIVRRARRTRPRPTRGRPVEDSSGLGRDERRGRVRTLDELGYSAREIAHALGIPYSTVLRDLGRKT